LGVSLGGVLTIIFIIIIIIIIIIIGKTALFEPQHSLEKMCYIASGFYFFGFHNSNFYRERSPGSRPTPNLEEAVLVFLSSNDMLAQL
jgi:hypothetical protein